MLTILFINRHKYERGIRLQVANSGKPLIDSQINDSIDEAINREIFKNKEVEEKNEGGDDNAADSLSNKLNDDVFDPAKEYVEIRLMAPVSVFSKSRCPYSRKLKEILQQNYVITPVPQYIELDKHKHGAELQEYIGLVTGRKTVPNVLVGFDATLSNGGCDDFMALHSEGKLAAKLMEWGGKDLLVVKLETPSNS